MEVKGWIIDDFVFVIELKVVEQFVVLCDNQIDVMIYIVGYLFGFIQEVMIVCDFVLVIVDGDVVDKLVVDNSFYWIVMILGGMYCGNDGDINIFGVGVIFVMFLNVFEDMVYMLVKLVFENFDSFKGLYLVFVNLKLEEMVKDGLFVLFYDGVVKYYKEKGWIN